MLGLVGLRMFFVGKGWDHAIALGLGGVHAWLVDAGFWPLRWREDRDPVLCRLK
jgi:hypothetical protein